MFLRVHARASSDSSTACTRERGTSWARASAMAPEPVHRSTISGSTTSIARTASMAQPTTDSVSGPGHEHPWPDLEFQVAEEGAPGDVLERLAGLAAGDDLPVAGVEVGVLDGVQLAPLHAVHERGELLRVVARRGHAGVGQPLGGLGHLREQQVRGASPPMLLYAGPPVLSYGLVGLTRPRASRPSPRRRRPGSPRRGRRPGPGPGCTP